MYAAPGLLYSPAEGIVYNLIPHFRVKNGKVTLHGAEMYSLDHRLVGYWPTGNIPVGVRNDLLRFIREHKERWIEEFPPMA